MKYKFYEMITSTNNAEHYIWGNLCDGWHLHKSDELSVIEENMPAGTAEQYHYHHKAQQVFYILTGQATFEIEGKMITVQSRESVHIPALTKHRILNQSSEAIRFMVISAPRSHGDRVTVELN